MIAQLHAPQDTPITDELPNNPKAEQAVLGSILIDPESYYDVSFLAPKDFWKDGHRALFDIVVRMIDAGEAPDFITVCNALELQGRINELQGYDAHGNFLQGIAYVACLSTIAVTSSNTAHYGHIVQNSLSVVQRLPTPQRLLTVPTEAILLRQGRMQKYWQVEALPVVIRIYHALIRWSMTFWTGLMCCPIATARLLDSQQAITI